MKSGLLKIEKLLCLALAAVLACLGPFDMSAYAGEEIGKEYLYGSTAKAEEIIKGGQSKTDEFEIKDGVLVKYTGTAEDVAVPRGVTGIGGYAFKNNDSLVNVSLPDGVTEIGDGAFVSCRNLKRINFPEGTTRIGHMAFYQCSSLETAVFPESLSVIGEEAFRGCWKLPNIVLPGNVKEIGLHAFSNCSGASSIIISEGVTGLGNMAFYRCMDVELVAIPDSVTEIEDGVFEMMGGFKICATEGSYAQKYAQENNISFLARKESQPEMFDIRNGVLVGYSGDATDLVIPKGVTSIASLVFNDQSYLDHGGAGKNDRLLSVVIPEGVEEIGIYAFWGCRNLLDIKIPSSAKQIGGAAFFRTLWMERKSVEDPLVVINKILLDGDKCRGNVTVPEGIMAISGNAFTGNEKITGVTLPFGVQDIGRYAFSGCKNLASVSIPSSVTHIGAGAFAGTKWMEEKSAENPLVIINHILIAADKASGDVVIPSEVSSIMDGAFSDCKDIHRIYISSGVTDIGEDAFYSSSDHRRSAVILAVEKDSYAESYAKTQKLHYFYQGENEEEYHVYEEEEVEPATVYEDGSITKRCSVCRELKVTVIYAPRAIRISQACYIFDNKNKKPSVAIKDSGGNLLNSESDFTVSYPENMKNVGQYALTVKFKGNYSGTLKKTITIVPKGTSISVLTPKKKGFSVKWKKQAIQTSGYEIAYSIGSGFSKKNTNIVSVGKNSATSKSLSGLKSKRKYFVRIRTYKTVKGKKYYSEWSKVKTVTTKK